LPVYDADRPEIHELVAEMRSVMEEFGERVLIGEIYLPVPRLMHYYGHELRGANLPFNFQLLQCPWTADDLARTISDYLAALPPGAWPNWVLGNHDRARLVSRIGARQARVAAMLLLTLRGTPTIYQGEELGMRDAAIPADEVQDPWEKNAPGLGLGRDPVRTPLRWTGDRHGGFTEAAPWLRLAPDDVPSVAAQARDPASMLSLYRALLALRRSEPALSIGSYEPVATRC